MKIAFLFRDRDRSFEHRVPKRSNNPSLPFKRRLWALNEVEPLGQKEFETAFMGRELFLHNLKN